MCYINNYQRKLFFFFFFFFLTAVLKCVFSLIFKMLEIRSEFRTADSKTISKLLKLSENVTLVLELSSWKMFFSGVISISETLATSFPINNH